MVVFGRSCHRLHDRADRVVVEVHGPDAIVVLFWSETTLSSSPLSDTMKESCWGCWGERGHAAFCRERSAAGSVWVRVVSATTSCASEVA